MADTEDKKAKGPEQAAAAAERPSRRQGGQGRQEGGQAGKRADKAAAEAAKPASRPRRASPSRACRRA